MATHGHRFTGSKSNWTKKHRVWLRKLHRELGGPLGTVLAHHLEHLEYLEAQKNALEMEIDRIGMEIILRYQPLASDLRMVIASMKTAKTGSPVFSGAAGSAFCPIRRG